MDEGMDPRRGPPLMAGSHWPPTDVSYQSGSSSRLIRMDETGESSAGEHCVCSQDYGKYLESSRPPIHKPAQASSKLVAARSSGARRMQRAQHGPWNALQVFPEGLNDPALESTGMDGETNIVMGLSTQLVSDEGMMHSGQEQADIEYGLLWGRGDDSSLDILAARGPVLGGGATEHFPGRTGGHITEHVGTWSGISGGPSLGIRQAQAGAGIAYPGGSSHSINERQVDGIGGSTSVKSLNSFYRDHQDFLNGCRNGVSARGADHASGSLTFNNLYMDPTNYKDEVNFQASTSNYAHSAEMEPFWAPASRHHGMLDTHAAHRSNGGHFATETHSLRSNVPESTSENGTIGSGNVSSSSRSLACKRKSCNPVLAAGSSSQTGSLHRGGFWESYDGRGVGGSGLRRSNTGIAGCTSASDGASTSSSAEATFMGLGAGPFVGAGMLEDPQSQYSNSGSETESLPEALNEGRAGKSAVHSSTAGGSSQRSTRAGPNGVVLTEAGAVQSPPSFARTVRRAVPGLSPENRGSWRTPLTDSSMDADGGISATNLLVHQRPTPLHNSSPVVGGRIGASASPQHNEIIFGSTGLGEEPALRYMGNSARSLATHVSSASQLGAAVAAESRLRDHSINYHSLESMSLTGPFPWNPVIPMMQTTANSAAPSSQAPLRPPSYPTILRSRLQGSSAHTSLPSSSSSGTAPSHLVHAPPFNPSVLAPSIDSLPLAASLLQGAMMPRSSAPGLREREFSAVAESLLGMPFRGLHMSAGDGAHQPWLVAEGLAEVCHLSFDFC
jgi:hypothetical protein